MSKKARAAQASPELEDLSRLHLRLGWWMLVIFLALGLLLETLHGFKLDFYLNVANHSRRFMWTLAHAHGTLLGVLNIALAVSLPQLAESAPQKLASRALIAATLLIPAGFFLGGLVIHAGDPGLGVLLVPPGGLLAIGSAFLVARGLGKRSEP